MTMNKNLIIMLLLGVVALLLGYIAYPQKTLDEVVQPVAEQAIPATPAVRDEVTALQQQPAVLPGKAAVVETQDEVLQGSVEEERLAAEEEQAPPMQPYVPTPYVAKPKVDPLADDQQRDQVMAQNSQAVETLKPMIEEYNANLFDREARARIEKQIAENSEDFKATSLQLAKSQLAREAAAR